MRPARVAVTATFAVDGLLFGSWAGRVPAVRDRLGLSDGALGAILACIALGAIVAMPLAGGMAARFGSRRVTRVALGFAAASLVVVALAPSKPVLAVLAFAFGASVGALDVAMNAHGVAIEQRYGRPILSGLHAAYSLGGLAGAGLAAVAAGAGVDARVHLALVGVTCGAVGLLWTRDLLGAHEDAASAEDGPTFAWPPRRLWALGALAFGCLLAEGAAGDWSAVYLRDELGASAGAAALAYTAFSATMAAGRLTGDALVLRAGPVALVRTGGVVAALGFGVALLVASPAAGLLGFAALGAGLACVVPLVFRAAGSMPGLPAGVSLAAVSSTGYLGFLAGPPVIGGVAELVGLPVALGLLVVLGGAVALLAPAVRTRRS